MSYLFETLSFNSDSQVLMWNIHIPNIYKCPQTSTYTWKYTKETFSEVSRKYPPLKRNKVSLSRIPKQPNK